MNADKPKEVLKTKYDLRCELRNHLANGEIDRVTKKGKICSAVILSSSGDQPTKPTKQRMGNH